MIHLASFLFGVFLLCLGAGWLVRGASTIATAFGIPKHIIGLTLVALGTSAPEFFVNVLAAWHGNTDFALSNVSGSNLANMCVGFGLCATLATVTIRRREFGSDVTINWLIPWVVLGMMLSNTARQLPILTIAPLTLFLVYYAYSLKTRSSDEETESAPTGLPAAFAKFLLGILGLYFGGELVLKAAIAFAEALKVSEDVIGLTVVAFGTSVPDITASVVAARKEEHGIAVGNIVGSNISNLLVVLNSTIAVSGTALATDTGIRMDYAAIGVVSLICWYFMIKRESIPKFAGIGLILVYVAYLTIRVIGV